MPQISVIVPVYQAEGRIERCVQSILSQDCSDFELLLIDDGSTDNSGRICDQFAVRDSRVRVIHKKNGGVSSARNIGLDESQGNYVTFVDSDDYVEPNYLSALVQHDCILAMGGAVTYYEDGTKWTACPCGNGLVEITTERLQNWFENKFLFTVWGKAFCKSILNEHRIRFREDVCYGEDTLFVLSVLEWCHHIWIEPKAIYHYIKDNANSLSHKLSENQIRSADTVDNCVGQWLSGRKIISNWYEGCNYPTKTKLKVGFYRIFEDRSMPLVEKKRWYRIFFSLKRFRGSVDVLFPEFSALTRRLMKIGSPGLFLAYERISCFRRNV